MVCSEGAVKPFQPICRPDKRGTIRDAIVAEFDVAPEQAENDLADFLGQLEKAGAIRGT